MIWLVPLYVLFGAALWGATWVVYLADCAARWAAPLIKGTPSEKLANVVHKLAAFMSTSLNWLVFTVILLELPKEQLLSTRLARHKRQGKGWRQRLAGRLGDVWLDPFDPNGYHI
jgi:hypothetical protein